jgi:alternate signal-mediated exported protein
VSDSQRIRRFKAIVAGAAGIALLIGGATYALWSADGEGDAKTVIAGHLQLEVDDAEWFDTSADRSDRTAKTPDGIDAHKILNMDTWKIVPGDTARGYIPIKMALDGDNMVAKMSLSGTYNGIAPTGFALSYEILDAKDATAMTTAASGALGGLSTTYAVGTFQAPSANNEDGQPDGNLPEAPTTAFPSNDDTVKPNLYAVIDVKFDKDTANVVSVDAPAALGSIKVVLEQIREPGIGNFTSTAAP